MSKAGWAGLLLLGAGFGLAAFIVTAGMQGFEKEFFQKVSSVYGKHLMAKDAGENALDAVVKKDVTFLEKLPEIKALKAEIAGFQKSLDEIDRLYITPGTAMLGANNRKDGPKLYRLAQDAEKAMKTLPTKQVYGQVATRAERVLAYKVDHAALVAEARKIASETPKTANDPGLDLLVKAAKAKYAAQASKIDQKMAALNTAVETIHKSVAKLEAKLTSDPKNFVASGRLVDTVVNASKDYQRLGLAFRKGLDSLAISKDKVLVDMKRSGTNYFHKYKVIEGSRSRETGWEKVTSTFYNQHKSNLGMTIYSKPEGVFEEDAVVVASPPGYNYVGNQRYGRWRNRNGRSFWEFYGQYHFMRTMFWGPSYYRPIYRSHWTSYRHSLRRGRSYYGSTNQYGSNGSRTRTRYKKSSYFKSRTARRNSGSGRSRYSGSRYSGSSRSGGYRSSRYRSSSYGGSGK
jgi:hypothetical protein